MQDKKNATVIDAMQRWGGGFVQSLAQAARRADSENLRRIKAAWPEYWRQYAELAQADKAQ